jgi:hypothetical protein
LGYPLRCEGVWEDLRSVSLLEEEKYGKGCFECGWKID